MPPNTFSCIQIITPRSSPTPSNGRFPTYLSTSEFDPVLYREELLRKAYLSKFPIDSGDRPDYLITIGRANKICSRLTLEINDREDKSVRNKLPVTFIIISGLIVIIFVTMLYVYFSGFVTIGL